MESNLAQRVRANTTIVCIGNRLRGDDGLGPLVADLLGGTVPAQIIDAGEMPEKTVKQIVSHNPETVMFVDAVSFGGMPGDMAILERSQLSSDRFLTHRFPLGLLMDFIKEETKADLFLLGIQPASTRFGMAVSPQVRQTVEWLVQYLQRIFSERIDLVDHENGTFNPDIKTAKDHKQTCGQSPNAAQFLDVES
ncbi:MAG: hydrogenase 3 maturation endopeptidase HyCI [Thermoactinomyces sp.]